MRATRNDEDLASYARRAARALTAASPKDALAFARRSIARRLFFTAAAVSLVVLLLASTALTQYYRHNAEEVWNTLLESYIRTIIADEVHHDAIQLGEPKFNELYSGWYWQLTRTDESEAEPRTSPSLSASLLPRLPETLSLAGEGRVRSGWVLGPDGRRLRLVEQQIDRGEAGVFLVQVAVPVNATEREIDRFQFALTVAFALLAAALAVATAIQVGFGLRPLRALQTELGEIRRAARERRLARGRSAPRPRSSRLSPRCCEHFRRFMPAAAWLFRALRRRISGFSASGRISKRWSGICSTTPANGQMRP